MKIQNKIERITELRKEVKTLTKEIKEELVDFIIQGFKNKGFINDPREGYNQRGLYNPELKISVWVSGVNETTVSVTSHLMKNEGMDRDYQKVNGVVNWNFTKKTFDNYYNTTFQKKVEKLYSEKFGN
jgi:hypothetical protein